MTNWLTWRCSCFGGGLQNWNWVPPDLLIYPWSLMMCPRVARPHYFDIVHTTSSFIYIFVIIGMTHSATLWMASRILRLDHSIFYKMVIRCTWKRKRITLWIIIDRSPFLRQYVSKIKIIVLRLFYSLLWRNVY